MSATLTPKRKSARDRPASSKEREGGLGERKREIDRSTRDRKPARNSVLTHTPEGSAGLSFASRAPTGPCAAIDAPCSTPSSPSSARPASLLPPPAPSPSRLTHPTDTPLSAAPATHLPLAGAPSTPHHLCVASERACVRNGGRGVWRAPQKRPRPLLPPPRQPPTCCLAKNRLTCPCQAQNAKSRRRRAARARRAAPAVTRPYRRLGPSEQPSRRPPIAPVVGLDRFCIAVL